MGCVPSPCLNVPWRTCFHEVLPGATRALRLHHFPVADLSHSTRVLVTLLLVAASAARLGAGDLPAIEFAHGLRDRGMPDLSAEYLEHLARNPPAGLRERLPFELASARREAARLEGNARRRTAL